jgi:hypothetical protein
MSSMMSTDPRRSIGKLGGVICGHTAIANPCLLTHPLGRSSNQVAPFGGLAPVIPPEYFQAVADLRGLALCLSTYDRPAARSSAVFSTTSGSKLVRPPDERLVPVEDDMQAHVAAARVLPFPDKDMTASQQNDLKMIYGLHEGGG